MLYAILKIRIGAGNINIAEIERGNKLCEQLKTSDEYVIYGESAKLARYLSYTVTN